MKWQQDNYWITNDKDQLNIDFIHDFLKEAYWSKDIPKKSVSKSIDHSLCFGVFHNNEPIGFARVVTDYTCIAYLADVFIISQYRSQGLAKWLLSCILDHPELQSLRRWILGTRDAHGLYNQFGFTPLKNPDIFMERHNPNVYTAS